MTSLKIRKDTIDDFMKTSDKLLDNQREAMWKVEHLKTKTTDPSQLAALEEMSKTSQQLRIAMRQARMIIKHQDLDKDALLDECNRAWDLLREYGHQPENAD